jgi:tRNA threonylcarbamoyl adenosine modification protein YeaZ
VHILGLDTATWKASVGLRLDGETVAEKSRAADGSHAVSLLSLIEEVLRDGSCTVRDLDAVAVSGGPGSFTGLRIGLSVAKGLAYATGARLIAVSTLEALARTVAHLDARICPVLDARKGELYAACFQSSNGLLQRLTDDRLLTPEELLSLLDASNLPGEARPRAASSAGPLAARTPDPSSGALRRVEASACGPKPSAEDSGGRVGSLRATPQNIFPTPCVILGDGVAAYGTFLQQHLGAAVTLLPSDAYGPSGGVVAAMADERLQAAGPDDLSQLEPRYIRPSEAELKWPP